MPNPQPQPAPQSGLTTCPNCGKQLHYAPQDDPSIAPWLCDDCARAWWPSELLPKYRNAWNPNNRDFGAQTAAVAIDIRSDRGTALQNKRGGQ